MISSSNVPIPTGPINVLTPVVLNSLIVVIPALRKRALMLSVVAKPVIFEPSP